MKRHPCLLLPALGLALAVGACEVGAAPPGEPLVVYLDGSRVLVLEPSDVSAPLDLCAALGLAPEDVRYAEINAPQETPIRRNEPSQQFPKRILAAFPAAGGVGAGWVDRVLGELPAELTGPPPVSFAPATEVHLRTLDVERAAGAVAKEPLRVTVGEMEVEYTDRELDDLPQQGPEQALGLRGGQHTQAGAPVASLIGDALERSEHTLADLAAAIVHGPDGDVRFESADLAAGTARVGAVKRNRKGLWRLKVWERVGDEAREADGLRGVDSIEIVLR